MFCYKSSLRKNYLFCYWNKKKSKKKESHFPLLHMSTTFTPTNAQLYAPSSVALGLALIGLIIIIIAQLDSANLSDLTGSNSITEIATANGFSGTISKSTATLKTTVLGLLVGKTTGKVEKASNADIINTILTGYVDTSSIEPDKNITATNSILEAIQKCCVLSATKLGSDFEAQPGKITSNDSIYSFLQKAQGQLNIGNRNLFSALAKITNITTVPTNVWTLAPIYGTTILPIGFFKPGTSIFIRNEFAWYTALQPGSAIFTFSTASDSATLTYSNASGSAINRIVVDIYISAKTSSLLNVYMSLITSATITVEQRAKSVYTTFDYLGNLPNPLSLQGSVTGNLNTLTFHSASATTLFQT